ncbi:hypothetical protein DMN91_000295 [Ooceraea biroi]|uniref:Reverse transcriptase domain-containing protein n=1 Tax=Ooceraea biroi TaxID=2015173 RepID=A0A3L8E2S7_OOCBI|nr:hypothetical protein DMN91_000295 [Ooceraea biroi]
MFVNVSGKNGYHVPLMRQAVRVRQGTSRWRSVSSGVPQGSVLGPLLFNLCTSAVVSVIRNCQVVRYADDLQLYLHCDPATLGDGIARVNEDIEALCCWASDNLLRSNPGKTKAMILGSARCVNSLDLSTIPPIRVSDSVVEFVTSARNLGICIAPTLSWRETVTATCNKICRTLYQLRTNSGCLPLRLRKALINSLIYPQLDYCSVVMSDITGVENTRLQRALNACVRFVFGVRRDEHIIHISEELGGRRCMSGAITL